MTKELALFPFRDYNDLVMDMTEEMSRNHSSVCYITLNKTFRAMLRLLRDRNISVDKFYFMDFITPRVLQRDPSERCMFLDSFDDLDLFAEKLLTLVRANRIEAVIFDSLSSFLVYKSDAEVIGFFDYTVSFLEEMGVDLALIALSEDAKRPAVKQMKMLVDNTRKP